MKWPLQIADGSSLPGVHTNKAVAARFERRLWLQEGIVQLRLWSIPRTVATVHIIEYIAVRQELPFVSNINRSN